MRTLNCSGPQERWSQALIFRAPCRQALFEVGGGRRQETGGHIESLGRARCVFPFTCILAVSSAFQTLQDWSQAMRVASSLSPDEAGCSQEEGPKKGFVMGSRTQGVQEILEKYV